MEQAIDLPFAEMHSDQPQAVVGHSGIVFQLACPDRRLLDRLTALLSPALSCEVTGKSADVAFRINPGAYAAPVLEPIKVWRRPPVLMFDESLEGGLRLMDFGRRRIVIHREAETDGAPLSLTVDESRTEWRIDTPPLSWVVCRSLARFLKYLLGCMLAKRGFAVMHASCVVAGGRGIVLCGDKGGGKSTFSFRACAEAGAGFVADDELIVRGGRDGVGGLVCTGWPRRVGLPLSALACPARRGQVSAARLRREQTLPEGWQHGRGAHNVPEARQRIGMDVDEFIDVFTLTYEPAAPLSLVVWLRARPEMGARWQISDGLDALWAKVMAEPKTMKSYTDYLSLTPDPAAEESAVTLQDISATPAVTLNYGLEALDRFADIWHAVAAKSTEH